MGAPGLAVFETWERLWPLSLAKFSPQRAVNLCSADAPVRGRCISGS